MKRKTIQMLTMMVGTMMLLGTANVYAQQEVHVGSMKGPTSMGLVNFMEDEKNDTDSDDEKYTFEMVTAADELLAKFTSDEVNFALVPANMASVLYNKTKGNVQVVNINTLGVLYLVTADDSITSIADLKGKTVYSTGKGQTPEYALNYLLAANGLTEDDVTVEFKSEATEVVATLVKDESAIGVLPQPFATVACKQNENLKEVCDLTAEWDKTEKGTMVTGVTIAKKDFIEANPEIVEEFLDEHEESVEKALENPTATAELIAAAGIVEKAPIAEAALPKCNITCMEGEQMKAALSGYLEVLFEQNPDSVGGNVPAEDFYYIDLDED